MMFETGLTAFILFGWLALRLIYSRRFWPARERPIHVWLRRAFTAVLVTMSGGFIATGIYVPFVVWDGRQDVTIHCDVTGERPAAVGCRVAGRQDDAEGLVHSIRRATRPVPFEELFVDTHAALADPFDGKPLRVQIWTSSWRSMFGRELSRSQAEAIVLGAEWPDGRRVWHVVDVPDVRTTREIRVSLP